MRIFYRSVYFLSVQSMFCIVVCHNEHVNFSIIFMYEKIYLLYCLFFNFDVQYLIIIYKLLTVNNLQIQIALLSKFLFIAHGCMELRNFATSMSILDGLENLIVKQLPAWKHLPTKCTNVMEVLTATRVSFSALCTCTLAKVLSTGWFGLFVGCGPNCFRTTVIGVVRALGNTSFRSFIYLFLCVLTSLSFLLCSTGYKYPADTVWTYSFHLWKW